MSDNRAGCRCVDTLAMGCGASGDQARVSLWNTGCCGAGAAAGTPARVESEALSTCTLTGRQLNMLFCIQHLVEALRRKPAGTCVIWAFITKGQCTSKNNRQSGAFKHHVSG